MQKALYFAHVIVTMQLVYAFKSMQPAASTDEAGCILNLLKALAVCVTRTHNNESVNLGF